MLKVTVGMSEDERTMVSGTLIPHIVKQEKTYVRGTFLSV